MAAVFTAALRALPDFSTQRGGHTAHAAVAMPVLATAALAFKRSSA
jgi:hypothetical protein